MEPSLLQIIIEDPLVEDEGCCGVTTEVSEEEAGADVIPLEADPVLLEEPGAFEVFEISPEGV